VFGKEGETVPSRKLSCNEGGCKKGRREEAGKRDCPEEGKSGDKARWTQDDSIRWKNFHKRKQKKNKVRKKKLAKGARKEKKSKVTAIIQKKGQVEAGGKKGWGGLLLSGRKTGERTGWGNVTGG